MGENNVKLSDLVDRLEGRRSRRFRRAFVDDGDYFPGEDEYTEWRLRRSPNRMLRLLDRSPQAADVLLQNFLFNDPGERKVVWFSRTQVIACEGPGRADDWRWLPMADSLLYDDSSSRGLIVQGDHSRTYWLTLKTIEGAQADEAGEALHLLHKIVALGTGISKVEMQVGEEAIPEDIPGLQDFVSLARSRRTVAFTFGFTYETGSILANHCSPMVELDAEFDRWYDQGESLAEAMMANRCPSRLSLGYFQRDSVATIAPALAAATCIEELTIRLPVDNEGVVLNAVSQNSGIQALTASLCGNIEGWHVKEFWKAALTSGAIHRIDAREIAHGLSANTQSEADRRECSEMIATMIRSNPRIASLLYDPQAHNSHIMEARVMPIVHLNRFRPIVETTFDDGSAAAGRDQERDFSGLVGSPLVRRHPELLYCLLRAGREYLLLAPTNMKGRRRASARLARKHARG